jgi:hypothetical protein
LARDASRIAGFSFALTPLLSSQQQVSCGVEFSRQSFGSAAVRMHAHHQPAVRGNDLFPVGSGRHAQHFARAIDIGNAPKQWSEGSPEQKTNPRKDEEPNQA